MNAGRDGNRVSTLLGASLDDGTTPVAIGASPISHILHTKESTTSYGTQEIAGRDENRIPVLMAVSSVDGVTPVAVYADPDTNELLTHNIV